MISFFAGVAYILTEEAKIFDPNVIKAALLHDTVEDTDTTFEEIELHFGEKVKNVVKEVTDDKSLPKLVRKKLQVSSTTILMVFLFFFFFFLGLSLKHRFSRSNMLLL